MLRQSPSWNQRAANGFKVKHALQVFLLLAICTWDQVRHKEGQRKEVAGDEFQDKGSEAVRMKFGRKDLRPRPENVGREEADEHGEDFEEMEAKGRGVGDDEIDINDQEIAEEADAADESGEDFGDKEYKETEDGRKVQRKRQAEARERRRKTWRMKSYKTSERETSHLMQVFTLVHENSRVY